jgi:hypothetical protein
VQTSRQRGEGFPPGLGGGEVRDLPPPTVQAVRGATYEMSHDDYLALRWEALDTALVGLLEEAFLKARAEIADHLGRLRLSDSRRDWVQVKRSNANGVKNGQG